MTKKLEEFFNVADETTKEVEKTQNLVVADDTLNVPAIQDEEQLVLSFVDVGQHSNDMDDLAEKAMSSFDKIMDIADNVEERNVANVLAAAVQMQKNAIEAKESKARMKIQAAHVLLKKRAMDMKEELEEADVVDEEDPETGMVSGDRNKILDALRNGMRNNKE